MDHALYRIFPKIVHRHYIFRILVADGQKVPEFPGYCFLIFQFVSDLNINLLTLSFSNKINFTIVKFPDKYGVSSSFQLQKNNILQYSAYHPVAVSHGCINNGNIAYIKLPLCFQNLFSFDVVTGNTIEDKCNRKFTIKK